MSDPRLDQLAHNAVPALTDFLYVESNPGGAPADTYCQVGELPFLRDGAWAAYTPVITGSSANPTLGTASIAAARWRASTGRRVEMEFEFAFGTAGIAVGTGYYQVSLPVPARALLVAGLLGVQPRGNGMMRDASTGTLYPFLVSLISTTQAVLHSVNTQLVMGAASPVVPAAQDDYVGWLAYESDS